jgi:hypothetical protein
MLVIYSIDEFVEILQKEPKKHQEEALQSIAKSKTYLNNN